MIRIHPADQNQCGTGSETLLNKMLFHFQTVPERAGAGDGAHQDPGDGARGIQPQVSERSLRQVERSCLRSLVF